MIKGQYQVEVLRHGKPRYSSPWFDNLVLDHYFTNSQFEAAPYICVGQGSTPPEYSDSALEQLVGEAQAVVGTVNRQLSVGGVYQYTSRFKATFDVGSVVGDISEFGVKTSASGDLVSRALMADFAGNPTVVSIAADEQLVVNYWLRVSCKPSIETLVMPFFGDATEVTLSMNNMLSADFFSKTGNGGMLNPSNSLDLQDARVYFEPQGEPEKGLPLAFVGEYRNVDLDCSYSQLSQYGVGRYKLSFKTLFDRPIHAVTAYSSERLGTALWQFNPPLKADNKAHILMLDLVLSLA